MKAVKDQRVTEEQLQQFQGKVMHDIAAASGFACAYLGDRLGLYKAMATSGPVNSEKLAQLTSTSERYIREWLINQAAGGYVTYEPSTGLYTLEPAAAAVLTDSDSPHFSAGGLQSFMALMQAAPRMVDRIKTGKGFSWGEQHEDLFEGTERFFRPAYLSQLLSTWIPSISGLQAKLEAGALVGDVGCGHGVSTVVMARAFPKSRFVGFDCHEPSIARAKQSAKESGVTNIDFRVVPSDALPKEGFDMIAFFDSLHDMSDPVAAGTSAKAALKPDGCLMIVEPMAGQTVEENFNEVGRIYSAASVLCCTANAMCGGKHALGTIATDAALADVLHKAGFSSFKRTMETPVNRVFQARI
jgi:2-polyprenyl-3-methyl-5-hydroxy-6-metoxy-1,4-benzoquinol methylase